MSQQLAETAKTHCALGTQAEAQHSGAGGLSAASCCAQLLGLSSEGVAGDGELALEKTRTARGIENTADSPIHIPSTPSSCSI